METPKFVTWKRYGFRHIIREGTLRHGGHSLCGGWWDEINYSVATHPTWGKGWDIGGEDRPLCGTCKKIWEKKNEN